MELTSQYQLVAETLVGNTGYANVYLRTYAKSTVQQIASNRSSLTIKSCLYFSTGSFSAGSKTTISTYGSGIDGVTDKNVAGTFNSGETILNEIGGWVTHNSDGTYNNGYASSDFVSTPWGWNATAYGTFTLKKIPRYATSNQSLNSKTETTIKINWSSDSTIDYIWYSKDNGTNWTAVGSVSSASGTYTITGLNPNTSYNIKTRVRRKDSQLTTDSSTLSVTTYNYPYITKVETSNLIIGNKQKLTLYNPLSRNVTVKMNKDSASGTQLYSGTTSSTSIEFTPTASTLYASIPSAKSGKCVYSVVYSSSTKTTSQYTYAINEANCKPTFSNFTYADTDTTITSLTGNNQILVNNNSNCKFTISTSNKAVAKNSASITKYKFEWGSKSSEATYSASAEVTSTINDSTGNILKVTAIDSRGLSTTVTKTITNINYINATIDEVNIQRLNGVDVETYLGLKLNVWKGNWKNSSDTNYDNQFKYVCCRVYDGSSWTSYFDITSTVKSLMSSSSSGSTITITVPLSKKLAIHANGSSGGFTVGKSYTIQVLIKDGNSSTTFTPSSYQATRQGTVPDGKVGFSRYKDSSGNYHYAINGMPDSSYTMKILGNVCANDIKVNMSASSIESSVPVSGSTSNHTDIKELKEYKTFLGSIKIDTAWYNVISTRHRNGASDGKSFGMLLYSSLTSSGSLMWNKQTGTSAWQGQRTILDSTNYSEYALPKNSNAVNVTQKKSLTAKSHSGFGTNNGYLPDISFISYWNGAYNSSNASNLTYAHQGTIQCKPTSLYDNSTGTNGTVTLSQTAANFVYLEIFYKISQSETSYKSAKIHSPNGKYANLEAVLRASNQTVNYIFSTIYSISGTSMTVKWSGQSNFYSGSSNNIATNNGIYIVKVLGWK